MNAVKASPILGLGQGKPYRTTRILDWKTESWMVHNAPLHVWIRYGLLGLLAYFWWHAAYFQYLNRLRVRWRLIHDGDGRSTSALLVATLAWSVGLFVIGLFFSEWSYTSLQRMVLIGTLWGLTLHPSVRHVLVNSGSRVADGVAPQRSHRLTPDIPATDTSQR